MKICIFGASSDRIDSIYVTETENWVFSWLRKAVLWLPEAVKEA